MTWNVWASKPEWMWFLKTIQDCFKVDSGPNSSHLENKISRFLYCICLKVKLLGKDMIRTRQSHEHGPLKMDTQMVRERSSLSPALLCEILAVCSDGEKFSLGTGTLIVDFSTSRLSIRLLFSKLLHFWHSFTVVKKTCRNFQC